MRWCPRLVGKMDAASRLRSNCGARQIARQRSRILDDACLAQRHAAARTTASHATRDHDASALKSVTVGNSSPAGDAAYWDLAGTGPVQGRADRCPRLANPARYREPSATAAAVVLLPPRPHSCPRRDAVAPRRPGGPEFLHLATMAAIARAAQRQLHRAHDVAVDLGDPEQQELADCGQHAAPDRSAVGRDSGARKPIEAPECTASMSRSARAARAVTGRRSRPGAGPQAWPQSPRALGSSALRIPAAPAPPAAWGSESVALRLDRRRACPGPAVAVAGASSPPQLGSGRAAGVRRTSRKTCTRTSRCGRAANPPEDPDRSIRR